MFESQHASSADGAARGNGHRPEAPRALGDVISAHRADPTEAQHYTDALVEELANQQRTLVTLARELHESRDDFNTLAVQQMYTLGSMYIWESSIASVLRLAAAVVAEGPPSATIAQLDAALGAVIGANDVLEIARVVAAALLQGADLAEMIEARANGEAVSQGEIRDAARALKGLLAELPIAEWREESGE